MSKESMESCVAAWFEAVQEQSGYRQDYLNCCPPDDSFGWGKRLSYKLCVPVQKLFRMPGLLLTGPAGCGRHTAAAHAVQYLTDKNAWAGENEEDQPFEALWLAEEGLEFLEDFGSKSVYECLNTLLDAYAGKPLCLVVEFPEQSAYCTELLRHLGRFSCMYTAYAEKKGFESPLFLIVITDEEERLPRQLRERLLCCRMQLPSYGQRLLFFQQRSCGNALETVVSAEILEELAVITERMNYAQLLDLTQNLIVCADCGYQSKALLEIAESQIPQKHPKVVREHMYSKINDLLDELPELLANLTLTTLHADAAQIQVADEKEPAKKQELTDIPADIEAVLDASGKSVDPKKFEEQTNNMTTHEIVVDVFGKNDAKELFECAAQLSMTA